MLSFNCHRSLLKKKLRILLEVCSSDSARHTMDILTTGNDLHPDEVRRGYGGGDLEAAGIYTSTDMQSHACATTVVEDAECDPQVEDEDEDEDFNAPSRGLGVVFKVP